MSVFLNKKEGRKEVRRPRITLFSLCPPKGVEKDREREEEEEVAQQSAVLLLLQLLLLRRMVKPFYRMMCCEKT